MFVSFREGSRLFGIQHDSIIWANFVDVAGVGSGDRIDQLVT